MRLTTFIGFLVKNLLWRTGSLAGVYKDLTFDFTKDTATSFVFSPSAIVSGLVGNFKANFESGLFSKDIVLGLKAFGDFEAQLAACKAGEVSFVGGED